MAATSHSEVHCKAGFPLAIFFARSEFIPFYLSNLFQMVAVESSETKVKSRFARKLSLVENRLKAQRFPANNILSPIEINLVERWSDART